MSLTEPPSRLPIEGPHSPPLRISVIGAGQASPEECRLAEAVGRALAEWIQITHGHQGIKVSVLCPQGVRTNMTAPLGDDGGLVGLHRIARLLQPFADRGFGYRFTQRGDFDLR